MWFPLPFRPKESYHEAPRSFGSARDGGKRQHAGCDLYAPPGTPVVAVADGEVLRGPYLFYDGVYALEIGHPGLGIVRYGEIQGTPAGHPDIGGPVKAGQIIGFVGKMPDIPHSMLHFELYSNAASGQLTDRSSQPYLRRSDLIDPTALLDSLPLKGLEAQS
jgi:murein DD-endopeptidase MepM/ murein hydrolase activator NlpD